MQNGIDILKLMRGHSQGGVDDVSDAAPEPTPEGGQVYTGVEEITQLDDQDFGEQDDAGQQEPGDGDQEEAGKQPEGTPKPAESGQQPAQPTLEERYQQEHDARVKLEGAVERLTQQLEGQASKPQPTAEDKKTTRAWQRNLESTLQEYIGAGGDPAAANRLKALISKTVEGLVEDLEPQLGRLTKHAEYSEQHIARQQAAQEKREAEDDMRRKFKATDEELKAADKFAREQYELVAQGKARFRTYEELYRDSLLEQRYAGTEKKTVEDKEAENQRLEAQRRANPEGGASSSSKTGPLKIPAGATNDFASLKNHLRQSGALVDG